MNALLLAGGAATLLLLGALVGRFYVPDRRPLRRAAQEGLSYVRGLVAVLDGQDDLAIQEIRQTLKDNSKTVEAYFALGALFRKRGEYERAVRVHQTILVRRDVDKKTRIRVHHQLALDFLAAGFRRRGIKALEFVIASDKKDLVALEQLAGEYARNGQWERACAVHLRLGKLRGKKETQIVASLIAQQAVEAMAAGQLKLARKLLRRAVASDPNSVHVLTVLGDYQLCAGKRDGAVLAWQKALGLRPALAGFFVPQIESALFEQKRLAELPKLLDALLEQHPGNFHLRIARARFLAKGDPAVGVRELDELAADAPDLLPAKRVAARFALEGGDAQRIRGALGGLVEHLERLERGYRCGRCGHVQGSLFWHCSRCGEWSTVQLSWGRRRGEGPPATSGAAG